MRYLLRGSLLILVLALAAAAASPALAVRTCSGRVDLRYVNEQNYYQVGDTLRQQVVFSAGSLQGSTQLIFRRVRVELDCASGDVPCIDDGPLVSYAGNITTTCPTIWTANSPGGVFPNEVVFSAETPFVVPADTAQFCDLQFDVQLFAFPAGPSINQAVGFLAPFNDAVCNTPESLAVGAYAVGAFDLCSCEDSDACTDDVCDPQAGCLHVPVNCDDGNPCTDDSCDPAIGCLHANNASPCTDGSACTTNDLCANGVCVGGPALVCDDRSVCTDDSCDPAVGCVQTPVNCSDGNACTIDTCEPALGCRHDLIPCDDDNTCTTDACDAATGNCTFTPADPPPPECTQPCRVTAGGLVSQDGSGTLVTDPTTLISSGRYSFGGQVGASVGRVGCHEYLERDPGRVDPHAAPAPRIAPRKRVRQPRLRLRRRQRRTRRAGRSPVRPAARGFRPGTASGACEHRVLERRGPVQPDKRLQDERGGFPGERGRSGGTRNRRRPGPARLLQDRDLDPGSAGNGRRTCGSRLLHGSRPGRPGSRCYGRRGTGRRQYPDPTAAGQSREPLDPGIPRAVRAGISRGRSRYCRFPPRRRGLARSRRGSGRCR